MSHPFLTASTITRTIGHVDSLGSEEMDVVHNRFRKRVGDGYYERVEDPNANATSARLYAKRELARAAVLLDAEASGIHDKLLISINDALNRPPRLDFGHAPSGDVGGSYSYPRGLDAAIRGVLANDPGRWILTFATGREDGRIVHTSSVIYVPEGERINSELALLRRSMFVGMIDLTARFKTLGELLTGAAG